MKIPEFSASVLNVVIKYVFGIRKVKKKNVGDLNGQNDY